MSQVAKVLGQLTPTANVLTALYTVPGSATNGTVISTIAVTNTTAISATFRISVAVAGAADATTQYLYYDITVGPKDTFAATIGPTLATTDQIRVLSSSGQLNFTAFGVENS